MGIKGSKDSYRLNAFVTNTLKTVEKRHIDDIFEIRHKRVKEGDKNKVKLYVRNKWTNKGLCKSYTVRKLDKMKEDQEFEVEKDIFLMKKQLGLPDPFLNSIDYQFKGESELQDKVNDVMIHLHYNCNSYDIYYRTNIEKWELEFHLQSRDNPYNKWQKNVSMDTIERIAIARGTNYIPVFITEFVMDGYLKKEDSGFRAIFDKKIPEKKEAWDDRAEDYEDIQEKVYSIRTESE